MKKLKPSKAKKSTKSRDSRQTLLTACAAEASSSEAACPRPVKRLIAKVTADSWDEDDDDFTSQPKKLKSSERESSNATQRPPAPARRVPATTTTTLPSVSDQVCLIDSDDSSSCPEENINEARDQQRDHIDIRVVDVGSDEKAAGDDVEQGNITKTCTLCDATIISHNYDKHFRSCLRSRYERKSSASALLTKSVHSTTTATTAAPPGGGGNSSAVCTLCGKSLGHMTVRMRLMHAGNCRASSVYSASEQKTSTTTTAPVHFAPNSCPVCLKTFKNKAGMRLHLKRCAAKYSVPIVDLEGVNHLTNEDRMSAALVTARRQAIQDVNKTAKVKKTKKTKVNTYEEDLKLAIALSTTLNESYKDHVDVNTKLMNKKAASTPSMLNVDLDKAQLNLQDAMSKMLFDEVYQRLRGESIYLYVHVFFSDTWNLNY